jgi:hypothetical protein
MDLTAIFGEEITQFSRLKIIFIENQQVHQNDHFIVVLSQTLLHVFGMQTPSSGSPYDPHKLLTD